MADDLLSKSLRRCIYIPLYEEKRLINYLLEKNLIGIRLLFSPSPCRRRQRVSPTHCLALLLTSLLPAEPTIGPPAQQASSRSSCRQTAARKLLYRLAGQQLCVVVLLLPVSSTLPPASQPLDMSSSCWTAAVQLPDSSHGLLYRSTSPFGVVRVAFDTGHQTKLGLLSRIKSSLCLASTKSETKTCDLAKPSQRYLGVDINRGNSHEDC